MLNFTPIFIVDAEFGTYLCSGCCIPIFLNAYSDFSINVTKSSLGVPWRMCQNTQSMLFPCLFREYMDHISPLLWGTYYPSLMSDWIEGKTNNKNAIYSWQRYIFSCDQFLSVKNGVYCTVPPLKCTLILALVSHIKYRDVCFVPAENIWIHFYMTLTFKSDLYYILIVNRIKQIFAFIELCQGGHKMFLKCD